MTKLLVLGFTVSLDGFGAGPNQNPDHPLGFGGENLHKWLVATPTFQKMHGKDGGILGVDEKFAQRGFRNIGAWIMGRNMFGPIRGPWPNLDWNGWWGDNPPYHTPVFVLTHYKRPPLEMEGETTFYFVTDSIESVLKRAIDAANGKDVRLGGGVSVIRQYLKAGLIDEIHLAISPVLLGSGENLLSGIDLVKLGYHVSEHAQSPNATHIILTKEFRKDRRRILNPPTA